VIHELNGICCLLCVVRVELVVLCRRCKLNANDNDHSYSSKDRFIAS